MYLIRERLFRLGEDSDITDEHGRPVLQVDGKVLSLRNRLVVRDPEGREVAQVQRKLIAMRPTYEISIAGHHAAEVRKRLFTPFGDRFTIDVPGPDDLEVTGDLLDHEFTIRRGDRTVATVSKRGSACATPTRSTSPPARTTCSCWPACWRWTWPRIRSGPSTEPAPRPITRGAASGG
jgi:uncharacterized protein YxjI